MQDIHAIGGGSGGGRLFAGGGDRRLRPQNHHQALKCPRCDSLNTKFCYYNNYNLSQPRHFCKNCRRYWTKGGVLRNVPVGGGCRKAKRSNAKQSSTSSDAVPIAREDNNSNSYSSSESSSLTVTTTAAKNTAAVGSGGEVISATVDSSNTTSHLINFQNSRFFVPQINENSSFDQEQQQQQMIDPNSGTSNGGGQLFQEIGGRFTGMMTSSNDHPNLAGFNSVADVLRYNQSSDKVVGSIGEDDLKMEPINCGFLDQTAQIGFSGLHQSRMSNGGGLEGIDWQINSGGGDHGFFDFTGTVDQAYWGQNQWSDHEQSLNFPPLV